METLKLDYFNNLPKYYTGIVEYEDNSIVYYLNGKIHREDGPACIYSVGTTRYYINGNHITNDVNKWLSGETDIPPYEKWDNNTRILFKLTFG